MQEQDPTKQTDHDLLITLHEQMKNLRADISDLKSGTSDKIDDLQKRVNSLEVWRGWLLGGLGVVSAGLMLLVKLK